MLGGCRLWSMLLAIGLIFGPVGAWLLCVAHVEAVNKSRRGPDDRRTVRVKWARHAAPQTDARHEDHQGGFHEA